MDTPEAYYADYQEQIKRPVFQYSFLYPIVMYHVDPYTKNHDYLYLKYNKQQRH